MQRRFQAAACAAVLCTVVVAMAAQDGVPLDPRRADAAVRDAFAFLYRLPADTAAAQMGSWVIDSSATTPPGNTTGHWRLVVNKLSDTGDGLKMSEMLGTPGTTPAQLAAAMVAMQKLEGKISRAEAEAALEINVTLDAGEIRVTGVSDDAQRSTLSIAGADLAVRVHGDWMRVDDRELEVDYERWSPATLLVGFGGFSPLKTERLKPKESLATFTAAVRSTPGPPRRTIAVTVQGNETMLDRVLNETRWAALAALLN